MDVPQQVGIMENFGAQLEHEKETSSQISGVFVEEVAQVIYYTQLYKTIISLRSISDMFQLTKLSMILQDLEGHPRLDVAGVNGELQAAAEHVAVDALPGLELESA